MTRFPKHAPARRRGFSLIELMVVVAIVGVLASIALPQLLALDLRTKRTERDVMLRTLLRSVRDYSASDRTARPLLLPRNPAGPVDGTKKPFDTTMGSGDPALVGWDQLTFAPDKTLYFRYSGYTALAGGVEELHLIAEGDLDKDGLISVREMTFHMVDDQWTEVDISDNGDDW